MIFVGDIAIPYKSALNIDIPQELQSKRWFANLEGSLESGDTQALLQELVVFNSVPALRQFRNQIDLAGVALANNHITDTQALEQTTHLLDELDLQYVGANENLSTSGEPLLLDDNGTPIVLLNFRWEAIGCPIARKNRAGVNPLIRDRVIQQVKAAKMQHLRRKLVVFLHWNYELEKYPQPLDRGLSKNLIDHGADAVIGCHAHRPLGIETYKEKPIVYGLGNWLFPQGVFWSKKLKFPDFCNEQLAFEIDWLKCKYTCHWFHYNIETQHVAHRESISLEDDPCIKQLSCFNEIPINQYHRWFKKTDTIKKCYPFFAWKIPNCKSLRKSNGYN